MFEKITIHAIHPKGWPVDFQINPAEHKTEEAIAFLERYNFIPAPTAESARDYSYTPDGLPICPKHGEVMQKREKQGDTWFSHGVTDSQGQKHYCRGYASKSSPGWHID